MITRWQSPGGALACLPRKVLVLEEELGHKSSTLLFSKLISRIPRPLSGRELWSHQFKARYETYLLGKHSKKDTGLFGNLSQTLDPFDHIYGYIMEVRRELSDTVAKINTSETHNIDLYKCCQENFCLSISAGGLR